jgi:hypothetical protein
MVIKKALALFLILAFTLQLKAQDTMPTEVAIPDSSFIDSLRLESGIPQKPKKPALSEVEKRVRNLVDEFYNLNNKTFFVNSLFYRFGNNYYSLPYQQSDIRIFNLNLNNLFLARDNLINILNYYEFKRTRSKNWDLSDVNFDFKPTLSAIQFSSGSYNYEDRYLNFQKNNFFNFCDAKLFIHSGKNKSPWNNKNYFDNIVLQTEKNFVSTKIRYNFLKLFSNSDRYNFANPINGIEIGDDYLQKRRTISHILDVSLFENIVDFSYLHQIGYEKIFAQNILKSKNRFYRNQLNLMIHLPFENYETDISLKADINDYKLHNYNEKVKDYFITIKNNSPGFNNLFAIQLINQIYFSDILDTTYIYPQISFDIPINERLTTNLSIGVKGKQYPFYLRSDSLDNNIKICFADFMFNYKLPQCSFIINPFIQQTEYDYQWILNNDSLCCSQIEKYNIYGFIALYKANYDFLSTQNEFRLNFNFTKKPDNLVYRPNFGMKLLWEVRKDVHHNNFLYARSELSYLKDFRNISLEKEKNEIFLDIECGININRFRISVLFENIFNQDYFMDEHNLINGYGTYLQVHWSFIN